MISVIRCAAVVLFLTGIFGVMGARGDDAPVAHADAAPATSQPATQAVNAHEQLAIDMIEWNDGVTAILVNVKDPASAQAAVPKLEAAKAKILELADRTQALGPPDAAAQQAIEKQMAKIAASTKASSAEMERIRQDPELNKVLGKHLDALGVFGAQSQSGPN